MRSISFIIVFVSVFFSFNSLQLHAQQVENYLNNRYPLTRKPYVELPLGTIKPKGWLHEMLVRQKNGATGRMDELYPRVMGERNGWLGGDGDQWERGPYWIDGLLPLAYILDDKELIDKALPWVEWALSSQKENGFFGPDKDYPGEFGVQRDNAHDWWPRMVMLKILQQYYSATGDERIITFMTNYFKYQLNTLPEKPLGHWTFWAEFRGADNLQAVYWLYNITGDSFLLELGEILHRQGHDFTDMFLNRNDLSCINSIHCVNLAQGIKEPVIYYQQQPDKKYLLATKKAFADIKHFHGHAQGMYGGDEAMHGNNPTQGSELCSAVELMYSLEKMIEVTGDLSYVDHLEKIAFNALPTQITDDFMYHQYFQQANQVMVTRHRRNFDQDHNGTALVFGLLTGYPCCTSNMHQGWPKFTQNLFYATPDNGIAALVFSPSEVTAKVAHEIPVRITEDTYYPMDDKVRFTIHFPEGNQQVEFPFHVRIPGWSKNATITINNEAPVVAEGGKVEVLKRVWREGDEIVLHLPMELKVEDSWYENSISIERGPLVYALKIGEKWQQKKFRGEEVAYFGTDYWEVLPTTKWNYGIVGFDKNRVNELVEVSIDEEKQKAVYPWCPENACIELKMKAKPIPFWKLYNEMSGPMPYSPGNGGSGDVETITLIPYGCTTLRVSQFPVVFE